MNAALLCAIALRFGGLALVAVGGGNALIPALHTQTVGTLHWLTDRDFGAAVALAQAAPGPNILLLPLIGWQIAGIAGAIVALAAFVAPSAALAVVGSRLLMRYERRAPVIALRWALRPVAAGLLLSAAAELIDIAQQTWPGSVVAPRAPFILAAAAVATMSLRVKLNPLIWLVAAACVGALG